MNYFKFIYHSHSAIYHAPLQYWNYCNVIIISTRFGATCLFTGQYDTEEYGTSAGVKYNSNTQHI